MMNLSYPCQINMLRKHVRLRCPNYLLYLDFAQPKMFSGSYNSFVCVLLLQALVGFSNFIKLSVCIVAGFPSWCNLSWRASLYARIISVPNDERFFHGFFLLGKGTSLHFKSGQHWWVRLIENHSMMILAIWHLWFEALSLWTKLAKWILRILIFWAKYEDLFSDVLMITRYARTTDIQMLKIPWLSEHHLNYFST